MSVCVQKRMPHLCELNVFFTSDRLTSIRERLYFRDFENISHCWSEFLLVIGRILHECFTVPVCVHIHRLQSSNNSILAHECLPCSMNVFSSFQACVLFACDDVVGRARRLVSSVISWSLIEPWLGDLGTW